MEKDTIKTFNLLIMMLFLSVKASGCASMALYKANNAYIERSHKSIEPIRKSIRVDVHQSNDDQGDRIYTLNKYGIIPVMIHESDNSMSVVDGQFYLDNTKKVGKTVVHFLSEEEFEVVSPTDSVLDIPSDIYVVPVIMQDVFSNKTISYTIVYMIRGRLVTYKNVQNYTEPGAGHYLTWLLRNTGYVVTVPLDMVLWPYYLWELNKFLDKFHM